MTMLAPSALGTAATLSAPWHPLSRHEVNKAVERRGPARVPLVGSAVAGADALNDDVNVLWVDPFDAERMSAKWRAQVLSDRAPLHDWSRIDAFIAALPDPDTDPRIAALAERVRGFHEQDRYVLLGWRNLGLGRLLALRGTEQGFVDLVESPEQAARLMTALARYSARWLRAALRDIRPDGIWTTDELAQQTRLFVSPQTFRTFIKPLYQQIGALVKANEVHWWFQADGNLLHLMNDLIEAGVHVLHPVSRGCMDEHWVRHEFGDRVTFCVGIDVERVLRQGHADDVRDEVRWLIDTFDGHHGGLCVGLDRALPPGISPNNLLAFTDEVLRYGIEHRRL